MQIWPLPLIHALGFRFPILLRHQIIAPINLSLPPSLSLSFLVSVSPLTVSLPSLSLLLSLSALFHSFSPSVLSLSLSPSQSLSLLRLSSLHPCTPTPSIFLPLFFVSQFLPLSPHPASLPTPSLFSLITGWSCQKYNFCRDKARLLSRQKYLSILCLS